jgi:hypothetical protein
VADDLPDVPKDIDTADKEFNREVVDLNIELIKLYRARQQNND